MKPREVLPGRTYMVTRRCAGRMFLLRPSRLINQVVRYVLAVASKLFKVELHAVCVLSNHYHIVLTDTAGVLPRFMRWVNLLIGRSLNAHHGRWENFFAPGTYSRVQPIDPEDVLAKILYVLTNPVAAALVRRSERWPGLWLAPLEGVGAWSHRETVGERAERPEHFFRKKGSLPEQATLSLSRPPACADLSDEQYQTLIENRLRQREEALAEDLRAKGKTFLGVEGVLRQNPQGTPKSREPRRRLNPQIAARDKWRRIEALGALKSFLEAHRAALEQFRGGVRDVLFPAGTWLARLRFGVRCAEP